MTLYMPPRMGVRGLSQYNPVPTGCVFYAPLWSPYLKGTVFKSQDLYRHNCTVSGATWGSQGRTYNGTTSTTIVPHHASQLLTTGGAIIAWIKPNTSGENDGGRIVDKSTDAFGSNGYRFYTESTFLGFSSGAGARNSGAGSLNYGVWSHVVASFDSDGVVSFYINGVLKGTPGDFGDPTGITTTNALTIGNRSGATDRTFDGLIGEVGMWNRVLSVGEILHIYNATKWRYQ